MTVTLITERPPATRSVPLLTDPDIGHYPEFAAFLAATFDLAQKQLDAPGLLDVDGRIYELIFIGRSGRPFPAGVEIAALVPGPRTAGYGSNRPGPVGNPRMASCWSGGTLERRSPQDNGSHLPGYTSGFLNCTQIMHVCAYTSARGWPTLATTGNSGRFSVGAVALLKSLEAWFGREWRQLKFVGPTGLILGV